MTRFRISNLFLALLLFFQCPVAHAQATVTKASFGKTAAGENVDLYTLRNAKGVGRRSQPRRHRCLTQSSRSQWKV